MSTLPNFSVLPPEINSSRLYTGAGPAPMLAAATAWDGLAAELQSAAASFEYLTFGLASGSWRGAASCAMADAAGPHVCWLNTAARHAEGAAAMARTAAAEFETALAATVHPTLVADNRSQVLSLVMSNLFGQNAPAIAAAESLYDQMWAQDVTAMAAYHAGASAIAAELAPWQQRLQSLANIATLQGASTPANPAEAQTIAHVMGGSGIPIPSAKYVQRALDLYIDRIAEGAIGQALFTPQGLYPVVGIKNLTFDESVAQGVKILDGAIRSNLAAGDKVSVFGYSQGATIASLEMAKLAASINPPTPEQVSFSLVGNPGNPNGGVAARFPGISFPSLGVTSTGATPDNLYPTDIYTIEYDGIADFPRYPLNIVSTLNALAGTYYLHSNYFSLTPEQIDGAIPLTNTVGPTMTRYYIIPTEDLPLLEPLRAVPVVGDPFADLIQPNLRVIVNLGYGDPNYGYSTSPPNVPTRFGMFPEVDPITVWNSLAAGTQQGLNDFGYGITHLNIPSLDVPSLLGAGSAASGGGVGNPALSIDSIINGIQATNTDIFTTISSAASRGYAVLLPTADLVNALVTIAPAWNINLFLEGIREFAHGDAMGLMNSIGYPVTADVTLVVVAAALEILIVVSAAQLIGADVSALVA